MNTGPALERPGIPPFMRPPLPHQLPYRADIDGLRAVAVLSVVAFHAFPDAMPGGFVGVDVFFVISGFLISSLIFDTLHQGQFRFAEFYARRIRRIFPALILVLAASFAAGWVLMLPREFRTLNTLVASGALFVPNVTLWTQTGYFAASPEKTPLLHLWSLGVEEQFYLVWPLVAVIFWKRRLPLVIALLASLSFAAGVFYIGRHGDAVFYLPGTRLWELLAGAFLAWRERRHLRADFGAAVEIPAPIRALLSPLGFAILLACDFGMTAKLPFPGWWAIPPVLATMMVVAAGPRAGFNRIVLAHPATVFVGLISYPLYLWHWPILSFLWIWAGAEPSSAFKIWAVLVSLLLAWLTYRFVEKPVRGRHGAARGRALVAVILAGMGVIAAVSLFAVFDNGMPERFPPAFRAILTFDYVARANKPWKDGVCFLAPTQAAAEWKESCIDPPTTPPEPLLMLWGDSHDAELIPGLESLQPTMKFRLGRMTAAGCPPVFDFAIPDHGSCPQENLLFFGKIQALKPQAVILDAAWYSYRYNPPDAAIADLEQTRIFQGMAVTIARLRQTGVKHILLIGPVPLWSQPLPDTLAAFALSHGGQLPKQLGPEWYVEDYIKKLDLDMRRFAQKHGAEYVSAVDAFCNNRQCLTMTGETPQSVVAFDNSHLSLAGSQYFIRKMSDRLRRDLSPAQN